MEACDCHFNLFTKTIIDMLETNYRFSEVYKLAPQIESSSEGVALKNMFINDNGRVALVAFKAGQKLDTHTTPEEVMVNVLEGEIEFTMLDMTHTLKAGEFLFMGGGVPHSVVAKADSKMMLVKIKA